MSTLPVRSTEPEGRPKPSSRPPDQFPESGVDTPPRRVLPAEWAQAYSHIGRMLLVAEAATTSIGIPWVPPTSRTKTLREDYYDPLKDFVRSTLVTVPTGALDAYAEDLEDLPHDEASAQYLHIGGLSSYERYALNIILFTGCFVLFFVAALWVRAGLGLAVGLSLFAAFLVTAVSSYVCSEESRRSTFHWLIFEELMRRRGMDQSDLTGLPVYAIGQTSPSKGTT